MQLGPKQKLIADETFERVMSRLRDGEPISALAISVGISHRVLKRNIVRRIGEKAYRNSLCSVRPPAWNKGKTGTAPWLKKHYFQKGHLRYTAARKWRPVGTVVTRQMSFPAFGRGRGRRRRVPIKYIKWTDDQNIRASKRWMRYARYVWQQANGPIPKGKVVVHLDMDRTKDDLDNLAVMTRGDQLSYYAARFPAYNAKRLKAIAAGIKREFSVRPKQRLKIRQCGQCSFDVQPGVTRCPKCNSESIEALVRSVTA